jgi:hypothetical protein
MGCVEREAAKDRERTFQHMAVDAKWDSPGGKMKTTSTGGTETLLADGAISNCPSQPPSRSRRQRYKDSGRKAVLVVVLDRRHLVMKKDMLPLLHLSDPPRRRHLVTEHQLPHLLQDAQQLLLLYSLMDNRRLGK